MKKKVFSKLLMGALLVASVSSFTSCKDYDDDINDLRSQINGLNTSLTTTVNDKIATVNTTITTLQGQLDAVKAAYAKADEGLQKAIDDAAATGKANASAITSLQSEVVNLKAADVALQKAIDDLTKAQADASALLKTQGESIVALVAADAALESDIKDAEAAAAAALTEAQKAQTTANEAAANLKATDAKLAALENTVASNLTTVNKKIDDAVAALDGRIKTNETNIATLAKDVADNYAKLSIVNAKFEELAATDQRIEKALNEAKEKLAGDITDEATARAKAVSDLETKIARNEEAIKFIQETTIPQLIKSLEEHIIPETVAAEVAKQLEKALPEALKDYMKTDDIKALVAEGDNANKTLIGALAAKVKEDSTALSNFTNAQLVLAASILNGAEAGDSQAEISAKALADAIHEADEALAGDIEDLGGLIEGMNDATDPTSLAGKLAALKTSFQNATDATNPESLAGRLVAVEDYFAPAAEGEVPEAISNIAAKIAQTTTFAKAMEEAAAEANGEILAMITSINLFANQHMAQADSYGKAVYTNGEKYKYTFGYENFDHELNFVYVEELGIYNAIMSELKKETWKFPEEYIREDIDNTKGYTVKGETEGDADYFEFQNARYRSYEDSILVRVSPTNADLRKAEIALINSKGENIVGEDNLVQIFDVQKYTREGYITRAAGESGLWVIKFKLNDEKVGEELLSKSYYNGQPIVYAVAVKNTGIKVEADEDGNETMTSEGVDRYVASEFDLSLATTPADHAYSFDVNNVIVDSIHNRYIETEEGPAGSSAYWTDDPERNSFRYELYWTYPCYPEIDPSAGDDDDDDEEEEIQAPWYYKYGCFCFFRGFGERIDDCDAEESPYGVSNPGFTYVYFDKNRDGYEDPKEDCYEDINAIDRPDHGFTTGGKRQTDGIDNRHLKDFLEIDFDYTMDGAQWAKIDIEFPASVCGVATPIKGFFVTLDQQFALESDNSEINAWVSYEYKNVGYYSVNKGVKDNRIDVPATLFKGNKGTIYIKDANNIMNGDVIGFRVHAVNLDGTLYDPDGRAFYVKFGKQETRHNLSFDITVTDERELAYAVQDKVDGQNPIVKFNEEQKAAGIDVRFFQRDQYPGSFIPDENYRITYTWRGNNNIIRGDDNSTVAYQMVNGTSSNGVDLANSSSTISGPRYSVRDFFDFWYSENANADIEDETDGVKNEWTKFNSYYADGEKVAANRLTKSVRAAIKKFHANRLIDGATYKITATIERKDAQTNWRVVNIIDIDITKSMPQELPEAFGVKSLQLTDENGLTFYVRPYAGQAFPAPTDPEPWKITWGETYNQKKYWGKNTFAQNVGADKEWLENATDYTDAATSWTNWRWAVDTHQYDFEEFFKGILVDDYDEEGEIIPNTQHIDRNYFFEFAKSGSFKDAIVDGETYETQVAADNGEAESTAVAVFDPDFANYVDQAPTDRLGGYHLPIISYKEVNANAKHEVKAGYIYRRISANLNEDGTAFLRPNGYDINGQSTGIQNQDWKTNAIAFDRNGKEAETSVFQVKYACAFDNAVEFKDSVWKKDNDLKSLICMTNIAYEDAKMKVVDSDYKDVVTVASKKISALDFTKGGDVDYVSTDYAVYTQDEKWLTSANPIQYFNAGLDNIGKKGLLTKMLADGYLIIPDLNPSAIKIETFSGYSNTTLIPTGSSSYVPADYFTWYFVTENGDSAYQSKDVAGIAFNIFHRTTLQPNLTSDVYGKITFPVVNVWNHNAKGSITLYVRFQKPISQAARKSR